MVPPLFKRWAPPPPPPPTVSSKKATPDLSDNDVSPSRLTQGTPSLKALEAPRSPIGSRKNVKKPKRRKREAGLEQPDEESPTKHKTILSKFEKALQLAEATRGEIASQGEEQQQSEEPLYDLQPMPQPAPVPEAAFEPTFSAQPPWFARPHVVEASRTRPFAELGIDSIYLKKLEEWGYKDALAVQTALLPMLHDGFDQHLGDICVSAKTGSGKTLAYLLPIVEALKDRVVPLLSAIIVVPSRQLVNQTLAVAEGLCAGTQIRVGTALGNVPFATEQKQLVEMEQRYDPEGARRLRQRASDGWSYRGSDAERGIFNDFNKMFSDHIPEYNSKVNILICTPGRLVEHIENTTGFLLRDIRWLVMDEADQLLDQNFQGWANTLMDALHGETPEDFMNAVEQYRKRQRESNSIWSTYRPTRQIWKIVLSATMEKDHTKLGTLKLKRPKLVVIQDDISEQPQALEHEESLYELPSTLEEFAVHVGDGSNKPLHLLYVLLKYVFPKDQPSKHKDKDYSSSEEDEDDFDRDGLAIPDSANRVLIFAKSVESASRLSHLLAILQPTIKLYLETMGRALTANASRKLLKSFSTGATRILIASDAASRGLDIPSITHVINYDVPSSIPSYVHRVGRTARAGKAGQAWTLYTNSEAAWFIKEVTKGDKVRRAHKVKRPKWKESAVTAHGRKKDYRDALEQLESDVAGE